jgi:hypothetical protein
MRGERGLGDGVHREGESRLRDFLFGVLVPVSESWQATNSHHDNRIAKAERHTRWGLRNRNIDPEPRTHGIDRRGMAGVTTGLNALRNHCLNLIDGDRTASDLTVADEHAVRQRKTEVRFHGFLLFRKCRWHSARPKSDRRAVADRSNSSSGPTARRIDDRCR